MSLNALHAALSRGLKGVTFPDLVGSSMDSPEPERVDWRDVPLPDTDDHLECRDAPSSSSHGAAQDGTFVGLCAEWADELLEGLLLALWRVGTRETRGVGWRSLRLAADPWWLPLVGHPA